MFQRYVDFFYNILLSKTPSYIYNEITYRIEVLNTNLWFKEGLITIPPYRLLNFKRSFSCNIANTTNKNCDIISMHRQLESLKKWNCC